MNRRAALQGIFTDKRSGLNSFHREERSLNGGGSLATVADPAHDQIWTSHKIFSRENTRHAGQRAVAALQVSVKCKFGNEGQRA